MLLTFARCQEILDTLPIGYYLGRDIPVTLDHTGTNSFYDTFNNSITLSYPLIARALEQAKVPDEEQAVRSMLFSLRVAQSLIPFSISLKMNVLKHFSMIII